MLVQANVVVPMLECIEQGLQMFGALNMNLVELLFECAKKTLDSPVLPWAMQIRALVADACLIERCKPCGACETTFIIRADAARCAVLGNGLLDMDDQMGAVFARNDQAEQLATAVVNDAKNEMQLTCKIVFSSDISTPSVVDAADTGNAVPNALTQLEQRALVDAQHIGDMGFANGDALWLS